jgi:hypothetical protein
MKTLLLSALICVLCGCKPAPPDPRIAALEAKVAELSSVTNVSALPPASPPPSQPAAASALAPTPKWEYKVVIETNIETTALAKEEAKRSAANKMNIALMQAMPGSFVDLDTEPGIAGEHGWELVAAVPQVETLNPDPAQIGKMAFVNTRTAYIILYFKRPAK